ncbi:MAG TPA: sugar phosphate nucleotidyltransferase [Acidimicrobiales bacterium]|nr:sugar phosphate nucleotidyltransferase [Acidimicrobiales bacterium]
MRVGPEEPVVDALPRLAGVGAVVDGDRFLGTITDAAVRRRLLAEADPADLVCGDVLDDEPVVVAPGTPDDEVRALLSSRHVRAAAIVDGERFIGQTTVEAPVPAATALALAGGRGERLQPLTFKVPKPLLQVGGRSILERTLESIYASRIEDVWLAVNYMADMIEERIGDGARFGLRIRYLREEQPLDTAGPLTLIEGEPPGPIVVTNTDQITNMSFARMVDYHVSEQADVTVAAYMHEVAIPYGVFELRGTDLIGVREKPTIRFPVNAGYYVVDPGSIALIPRGERFGMDELMDAVMRGGGRVVVFPMVEKWIDIGTPEALEQALLLFATGEEV